MDAFLVVDLLVLAKLNVVGSELDDQVSFIVLVDDLDLSFLLDVDRCVDLPVGVAIIDLKPIDAHCSYILSGPTVALSDGS